ncbi:MAG: T9SS type A sorting domain-containing protein [Spirochaetes bacterium]|nr:T9SS type A sorting domain-containing protein [Spirochaetota bacterium]
MNQNNKKALCLFLFCICIICLTTSIFPFDAGSVIAYPVPFNPNIHGTLRIDIPAGIDKEKIEIFDINGDSVFTREYSSLTTIMWNGRNKDGKLVNPGLYIIKITLENTSTGQYGRKIIRILVNR